MENFSQILDENEKNRKRILAGLIESGVKIPCIDGVVISEEAEIEAGAVILPNTQIYGKTKISAGAVIGPSSVIEDSVIGKNVKINASQCSQSEVNDGAEIGPFVRLRPNSFIGRNSRIGNFVEIKNTSVGDETKISHLSYAGDSVIGNNVNIGCGCATVNFDGRNKNKTIIEDGAFIGCGVNLVAPVKIGEDAFVAAGSTVTEDVTDGALCIARSRQVSKEGWVTKKKPYKRMN